METNKETPTMLLIEKKAIEEIKTYVKQTRYVDTINLLTHSKEVEVVDIYDAKDLYSELPTV